MKTQTILIVGICTLLSSCARLGIFIAGGEDKVFNEVDDKKLEKYVDEKRGLNWPEPTEIKYPDNSFGSFLQEEMAVHCQKCGFGEKKENRNYVPNDIKLDIGNEINQQIEVAKISGENILFYAFTKDEIEKKLNEIDLKPSRVINFDLTRRFEVKNVTGFDAFYYSKNCGGFLNSSADINANFPIGALEAAIKSDISKESAVSILRGWFISPIKNIDRSSSGYEKNLLYSSLWLFYYENKDLTSKPLYFLEELPGFLYKNFSKSESQQNLKIGGSVNLKASIINLDINTEMGMNLASLYEGKKWRTVRFKNYNERANSDGYNSLPTFNAVQDYFKSTSPEFLINTSDQLMAYNKEYNIKYFISGFHPDISKDFWTIEKVEPSNIFTSYSISSQVGLSPNNENGCLLTFKGMPNPSFFNQKEILNRIDVKIILKSKAKVLNDSLVVVIPHTIKSTASPSLILASNGEVDFKKETTSGHNKVILKWQVDFIIDDSKNLIEVDKSIVSTAKILQGGKEKSFFASVNYSNKDIRNCKINIEYSPDENEIINFSDKNEYDLLNCEISLKIPLSRDRGNVERLINATLKYPKAKVVEIMRKEE